MKVVIIGGVAAGATVASRLRRLDKDIEIVILEKGHYVSYANCGLPYYISNQIPQKDQLLLMTPQLFKDRFDIDVRVGNEVTEIISDNKEVRVYDHLAQQNYLESYDKLIIATGSSPAKLPIKGIDNSNVYQLWTFDDFEKIKQVVVSKSVKSACIIGGGFVGIETAENLIDLQVEVDLIEKSNQILNNIDYEMIQPIQKELVDSGIHLYLDTTLQEFDNYNDQIMVKTDKGNKIYDMVILSVGVKPNSQLALKAGIECNNAGGIKVDKCFQTNIRDIYAIGDVIEVEDCVLHHKTMIPLAGPANKQGRMLADIIKGKDKSYSGSLGTSIIKVFHMAAASTGLNEKQLNRYGHLRHQDYQTVIIQQKSHAGYYPDAKPLFLKIIYDNENYILGAQVVGYEGVDKRIDIIATAMKYHGKVTDLQDIHVAYAPPFASAKDAINMLGYVSENVNDGNVRFILPDEFEQVKDDVIILDVREDDERKQSFIEGSYHIPYGQLSQRYQELDKNKTIVVYCAIGVRAYNCARILMQRGFDQVFVLSGGLSFYQNYCFNEELKNVCIS